MRKLINIVSQPDDLAEGEQRALRGEWHVLIWNGSGWNWSEPMSESEANAEYTKQLRIMPNAPAKMICIATVNEYAGENAGALNVAAANR